MGLSVNNFMKPVVQEDKTGCAIASSAAIAGITYKEAKDVATDLGICTEDSALWSETNHIRALLNKLGVSTGEKEIPFASWESLPNFALLSIKWHVEGSRPYWHWVVFKRENNRSYVLDSKKLLKNNIRTDFGRIKP